MFDAHAFFKKRLSNHFKETSRYLRYIFNGHIAVALLFFISAFAYYYQQWLTQLPENFPTAIIMGVVFGIVICHSPVRTLLKEPDLVFLIPTEHRMGPYFRNALIYSFVIQLYSILLLFAAFGPLYFASYPDASGRTYLLILIVALIFKIWNLLANWWMLKIRDESARRVDLFVRFFLNGAVFYFLVDGTPLFAGIATVLYIIVFLYDYSKAGKQAGLAWDVLVEKDRNRMQTFYRFANMFTDVPHLKNRVKRRMLLVSYVTRHIPFQNKSTYDYLYRITFLRSGDYLGMYIRLVIIGGLFILYIPNVGMKIIFGLLFLYLSSFQMMPLYQHHRVTIWLDLYPVAAEAKHKALIKWMFQLTFLQIIIHALLFLLIQAYLGFLSMLGFGLLFNFMFINGYVKGKLQKS